MVVLQIRYDYYIFNKHPGPASIRKLGSMSWPDIGMDFDCAYTTQIDLFPVNLISIYLISIRVHCCL